MGLKLSAELGHPEKITVETPEHPGDNDAGMLRCELNLPHTCYLDAETFADLLKGTVKALKASERELTGKRAVLKWKLIGMQVIGEGEQYRFTLWDGATPKPWMSGELLAKIAVPDAPVAAAGGDCDAE